MSEIPFRFRIAIATNSGERIDGHFGSCKSFVVYDFDAETTELIETREATQVEGIDKNDARAAQLHDCHLLYVASIGGPAAAKVIKTGVHPLKDAAESDIDLMLERLQTILKGNPPPWMAKLMGQANPMAARVQLDEESA